MEQIVGHLIQPQNNDKLTAHNSTKMMTASYSMLSNTTLQAFVQGQAWMSFIFVVL